MAETIETITLKLPKRMGNVNCYLVGIGSERILIDTGPAGDRGSLEWGLQDADCTPGDISLVVLTHGDSDHAGNCAFVRSEYKTKIAMHVDEVPAVKTGDLAAARPNVGAGTRRLAGLLRPVVGLKKADRFSPDMTFEGNEKLKAYGVDALLVHTPGHSIGSVSVLTREGDLFCGDLMENVSEPAPGSIVDDAEAQAESIEHVFKLGAKRIHPGHGDSFTAAEYQQGRM